VVRHKPGWREPYSGSVPLVSGEIATDITLYLSESEQIPSSMGLGVAMANDESAVAAAGFLVQILPGATDEEISIVESNVRSMPPLTQLALSASDADELIDLLLAGLGSRDRTMSRPIVFCPCTRERALRTRALLDRHEIEEIAVQEGGQEVRCHFCARAYVFAGSEVISLLGSSTQR
jgi:molecular chaperone Hsp33